MGDAVSEIGLRRTILERLECSFARQEAKLDKLLQFASCQSLPQPPKPTQMPQPPQPSQPHQQFSAPDITQTSMEYLPYSFWVSALATPRTALIPEVDRYLDDVSQLQSDMEFLGMM